MSIKNFALCIGIFSIIIGWVTYDPEVKTAVMPVITGILVVILALFGLVPEFFVCERCGMKSLSTKGHCRHCGYEGSGE